MTPNPDSAACLQIKDGNHLGRTILLNESMVQIGAPGDHMAVVSHRNDGYHLTHLTGDKVPRVNGQSIGDSSRRLEHGDEVQIGSLILVFRLDQPETLVAKQDDTVHEQRRFTRVAFDAPAEIQVGESVWAAQVIDLSLRGALISRPAGWTANPGDRYVLHVNLDGATRISMDVSISHTEENQIGLSCLGIDVDSITLLRRLIELNVADPTLLDRELSALG